MLINLKGLAEKLNETTRKTLEGAAGLCLARTHYNIEIEHFLLKLLEDNGTDWDQIATRFGLSREQLSIDLNRSLDKLKSGNPRTPAFSALIVKALSQAWVYGSLEHKANRIRSGHLIAALVCDEELTRSACEFTREFDAIRADEFRREFSGIVRRSIEDEALMPKAPNQTEPGGLRIFVSYRRDDSAFYVDYLFDKIIYEVPGVHIFRGSDILKPGMVYTEKIDETIADCDMLLAVIGRKWLGPKTKGGPRRIDLPDDGVRLEVASALQQNKKVIPCLISGARMASAADLPADLQGLASRHAVRLSEDDLRRDLHELLEVFKSWRRT